MHWFTTTRQGTVTAAGTRVGDDMHNGNAVMYDVGKILICGGATAFARPEFTGTDFSAIIEIGAPFTQATSRQVGSLNFPRVYGNTNVLPDGKVIITGGSLVPKEFSDETPVFETGAHPSRLVTTKGYGHKTPMHTSSEVFEHPCRTRAAAGRLPVSCAGLLAWLRSAPCPSGSPGYVLRAEIWDPATEQWTALNAQNVVPRTYHNSAVLLPDGRIFEGGGGLCDCDVNHLDAEIFSPPYLFNANGTPATRPVISPSREIIRNGNTFRVFTDQPLSIISIIRYGSSTHSTNTDQRRIELCGFATQACTGTNPQVQIPADRAIALRGNWMLFGVNNAGVPSVASNIIIR